MGNHVKANQDPVDRRARNWKTVVFGLTLTVIGADVAQAAEPLAYVRSSSQHGKARVHHALNLLDDDPESIWCEGRAGLGEGGQGACGERSGGCNSGPGKEGAAVHGQSPCLWQNDPASRDPALQNTTHHIPG